MDSAPQKVLKKHSIMIKLIKYIINHGKDHKRIKQKVYTSCSMILKNHGHKVYFIKQKKPESYEQIKCFLSKRFQCVRINGKCSKFRKMDNGVPKGDKQIIFNL